MLNCVSNQLNQGKLDYKENKIETKKVVGLEWNQEAKAKNVLDNAQH